MVAVGRQVTQSALLTRYSPFNLSSALLLAQPGAAASSLDVILLQGGTGPPEVATGGRDGAVRVWDTRQHDAPVAAFLPQAADKVCATPIAFYQAKGSR